MPALPWGTVPTASEPRTARDCRPHPGCIDDPSAKLGRTRRAEGIAPNQFIPPVERKRDLAAAHDFTAVEPNDDVARRLGTESIRSERRHFQFHPMARRIWPNHL